MAIQATRTETTSDQVIKTSYKPQEWTLEHKELNGTDHAIRVVDHADGPKLRILSFKEFPVEDVLKFHRLLEAAVEKAHELSAAK